MLKPRHIIFGLLPALLFVAGIFGFRAFQYKILFYDTANQEQTESKPFDLIPILPDDPIVGVPAAPLTLIAFEDFGCEGCKTQNILLKELEQKHPGKVKIIWKGLPVATFPYSSEPAHEYAYCAEAQGKFDAFKEFAFANHSNLSKQTLETIATEIELNKQTLQDCLASEGPLQYIDTVRKLAQILHVQHVPTFFFDDKQILTPASIDEWEATLGL